MIYILRTAEICKPPGRKLSGRFLFGGRMDKLAVFQCDDSVSQSQRLDIIARFAAHGIDCLILPEGADMLALVECEPIELDDEDE